MAAVLPRLRTPRDGSSSSPSRTRSRTGTFFNSGSKLVKRAARESRFVSNEEFNVDLSKLGSSEALSVGTGADAPHLSVDTQRSGQELDSVALELEEPGWYAVHVPPGGLEPQPYSRDPHYLLSYAHSSLNWESLVDSLVGSSTQGSLAHSGATTAATPPRRVLALGCGPTPFWILSQAGQPGWEKTEFVGLDSAPSSASIPLPPSCEVIQHDLKERLPFADASFDFVRMSFVNLALREQDWQDVCEEALRVLKPGKSLEIVESDQVVLRHRRDDSRDDANSIDTLFSDVLTDRFINPRPLTVLPSTLIMSGATGLRSTGRISLEMPSLAANASSQSEAATGVDAAQPLGRYVAGRTSASRALRTTETRVLLHAYADHWASSSFGLATAAVGARRRAGSISGRQGSSLLSAASSETSSGHREVEVAEDVVHAWADDLRSRADVASLLASRLGWSSAFDVALASSLETTLETCMAGLHEVETHRRLHEDVFGEPDAELERRWQQVDFARRDAAAELEVVRARLSGRSAEGQETLGSLDFEVFVAQAALE